MFPVRNNITPSTWRFEDVPAHACLDRAITDQHFQKVPDDWVAISTDVLGSTQWVDLGRQKDVNFVGAASIAALQNACQPIQIPFQFGGDGAIAVIPPSHATQAKTVLARTRAMAHADYRMDLRIGAVPAGELERRGAPILVGRFEPSPGNAFGLFSGGGFQLLETALKERGHPDLTRLAQVGPEWDDGDPPDLSGLSCRLAPLKSLRGNMIALLIQGRMDKGELYRDLCRLTNTPNGQLRAASPANLQASLTLKAVMLEAKALKGKSALALSLLRTALHALLSRAIFAVGRPIGRFSPQKYFSEMAQNTDFVRVDDVLGLVFDCPGDKIPALTAYLDQREESGDLHYGIQISDVAIMTCLVQDPAGGRHVHFLDGGDGGYTAASKRLKSRKAGD